MPGGSIQNMMNTLRNNKLLLGTKRSLFKNKFQILREDYQAASNITLKGKKATKEELSKIRIKVLQERKRENKIQLIILVFILLIISTFTYSILTTRVNNVSFEIEEIKEINQINYNESMNIGIQLLNEKKWFYAAGYFENALLQIPNNFEAEYNLTLAYCLLCYNKKEACEKANTTINKLITNSTNNNDLIKLKEKYLE